MSAPRCARCEDPIRDDQTAIYQTIGDRIVLALHWLCAAEHFWDFLMPERAEAR